jgi:hypothetical protein
MKKLLIILFIFLSATLQAQIIRASANYVKSFDPPEMVLNGGFTSWSGDNPVSWSVSGESGTNPMVTQVGNAARMYTSVAYIALYQDIGLTIGVSYTLRYTVVTGVAGGVTMGTTGEGSSDLGDSETTAGTYSRVFTAAGSYISFKRNGATDITITNISVKLN